MNINDKVIVLQNNEEGISQFIEEHIPFVIGKVSKATNRYIRRESDETFVVGLEAFHEAIQKYDINKGMFLSFANQVIKSRLIDWMRKEKSFNDRHVSIGDDDLRDSSDLEEEVMLKEEVYECKQKLAQFGVTFDDLVDQAPQKGKTLRKITDIGRQASKDSQIVDQLYATKKITNESNIYPT